MPGIPESAYNIDIILKAVGVRSHPFTISSDFKFLMPCFGLMSCSSTHPCLFCVRWRRKGVWEVLPEGTQELRTFGSLQEQYKGWVAAGSRYTTPFTSRFQSTVGPVLVKAPGDRADTTVLENTGMPTVHLLLSTNDVIRPHLIPFFKDEAHLMEVIRKEMGCVPHSYQGKDGAFEGPQCSTILDKAEEVLGPFLQEPDGQLLLNLLNSLKEVKKGIFGSYLSPDWEAVINTFKEDLELAYSCTGLPITPKLHVIHQHLEQVVRQTGRLLGRLNEAAVFYTC